MKSITFNSLQNYARRNGLPPLPRVTRDREGLVVRLDTPNIRLNLASPKEYAWPGARTSLPLYYAVRLWLLHRIEKCSSGTVSRDFSVLEEFLAAPTNETWGDDELASVELLRHRLPQRCVKFLDALRLRDAKVGGRKLEASLERLRGLYQFCADRGIPGFHAKGKAKLQKMKAPSRKNGTAVMSWDPNKGPLTRVEELLFRAALSKDTAPLKTRVACWLVYGMGLRPKQIVLLLESDLRIYVAPNGARFFHLDVPRVKKQGVPDRTLMKRRKIGPYLGEMLYALIHENRRIKTPPGVQRTLLLRSDAVEGRLDQAEHAWAFKEHEHFIANVLIGLAERAELVSPRTGKMMHVTSRRLRYTFATNKAEYCTPAELAELLDHTDLRSVLVYYNARESIGAELGAKLAKDGRAGGYRSVMNAFAGIPITVESGSVARNKFGPEMTRFIPHEMVDDNMREIPGIGSCGGNYSCGSVPIVACYGCDDFVAWDDADHGAFADWLGTEIESLRKDSKTQESTLADFEIAYLRCSRLRNDTRLKRARR